MVFRARTAICTAGTSFLTNLSGASTAFDAWRERQPVDERRALREGRARVEEATRLLEAGKGAEAGAELAKLPGVPRAAGAEACSLLSMKGRAPYEGLEEAVFLHSDTAEGEAAAAASSAFVRARAGLATRLVRVEGLQGKDLTRFKVTGLRNLVREAVRVVNAAGDPRHVVINATGGYKAQIAVAAVVGQVFGVRVVYRHEEFAQFIELPPLPVQLDYSCALENLDLLRLELVGEGLLKERFGPMTEANEAFARFRCFLEEMPVRQANEDVYLVSPLAEAVLARWEALAPIVLPAAASQTPPAWGTHHRPAGAEAFVTGLLKRFSWISRVEARDAKGRTHAEGVRFRLEVAPSGVPGIHVAFVRDNHPALLVIRTTARSMAEQQGALHLLEKEYPG